MFKILQMCFLSGTVDAELVTCVPVWPGVRIDEACGGGDAEELTRIWGKRRGLLWLRVCAPVLECV